MSLRSARRAVPVRAGSLLLALGLAGTLVVPVALRAQQEEGEPPVSEPAPIPDGKGTLAGEVRAAEDGEPLTDALVVIRERKVGTETNANGRFAFRRFASGRYTVEIRYLGRRSKTVEAVVRPGRITHLELELETEAVELPGLEVAVERSLRGKMAGFWERKRRGLGQFFTREEIEASAGDRFHAVFRGRAGIDVVPCGRGSLVGCYRIASGRGICGELRYYVDGAPVQLGSFPQGINEIQPVNVQAVEVYTGPSQVPARFSGMEHGCGAVVIWTRAPGLAAGEDGGG